MSFPIIAIAENWGNDATLAIKVTVVDEQTDSTDTQEILIATLPVFPGEDSASGKNPSSQISAPADGKGPSGTVRFVEPQVGEAVPGGRFSIVALGETWGVDSYLHISVEVTDVTTGFLSYVDCRCNTHSAFPGQTSQTSN